MGLVLVITTGAVIIIKTYNALKAAGADHVVLPLLRQQAAVVATLAAMVFLLIDALEKGKVATSLMSTAGGVTLGAAGPSAGSFGQTAAQRAATAIATGVIPG